MPLEIAAEPNFGNMMHNVSKRMDQLQKGFFSFCPNETWTPSVNLYENDRSYILCIDLAGVDKDKIDLVVSDNQLRLRGKRPAPLPPRQAGRKSPPSRLRVHLMEIDHGTFCRVVELPQDVNHDKVHASYQSGMLWIELPKK